MPLTLHGCWRSGTSYRTRIALNLKGLKYAQITHDLRKGEHETASYTALAPQGLVPALEIGEGVALPQSVAILEWMEETHPEPPLLPRDANDRAVWRGLCLRRYANAGGLLSRAASLIGAAVRIGPVHLSEPAGGL
ncbi:glutathione S-transferase N-terminal domain-containing protein [Croceicoccus sediminis]|uniref:glutathione S-transferase N-terminal domain-containing protein n=1 Tax=Croceicoccus sediminis TaxID=2571150 RepID=UPI0014785543